MNHADDTAREPFRSSSGTVFRVSGDGPVLVLDAGLFSPDEIWGLVSRDMNRFARVVEIDRPDLRAGSTRHASSSPIRAADDSRLALHQLTGGEAMTLVGWSAGAIYARAFALIYPDRVANLVLVEPIPEDLFSRLPAESMAQIRSTWSPPGVSAACEQSIVEDMHHIAEHASPPRARLVLITGDRPLSSNPDVIEIVEASHARYLREFLRSRHVIAGRSCHRLPTQRPDVLIDVVHELLG